MGEEGHLEMFWYMIAFALISPLVGIFLVEGGALSWSVGTFGFPNGATIAYAQYLAIVISTFFILVLFH